MYTLVNTYLSRYSPSLAHDKPRLLCFLLIMLSTLLANTLVKNFKKLSSYLFKNYTQKSTLKVPLNSFSLCISKILVDVDPLIIKTELKSLKKYENKRKFKKKNPKLDY